MGLVCAQECYVQSLATWSFGACRVLLLSSGCTSGLVLHRCQRLTKSTWLPTLLSQTWRTGFLKSWAAGQGPQGRGTMLHAAFFELLKQRCQRQQSNVYCFAFALSPSSSSSSTTDVPAPLPQAKCYSHILRSMFPDTPERPLSGAWEAMLRADCPDCPWWPENRTLPAGYDDAQQLAGLLGPNYDSPAITDSNMNVFHDDSITTVCHYLGWTANTRACSHSPQLLCCSSCC
jgi:hypothetical protein